MFSFLRIFGDGPTVHIAPVTLFTYNGFPITNSMIFAWITSIILIITFMYIAHTMTIKPKGGFTQIVEIGTDFIMGLVASSLGSREKATKYAPYFTAMFFFIAMASIFGLLPGIGEAVTFHGEPVFRAVTADLNATLAAALVSMTLVQVFAVRESGFWGHMRHYFAGSLKNPLTYVMGLFEMFGELTRLFSLALRLFLNIAIGEIIISIFAYLGKFAAPISSLPFLTLELGVCLLQAYIFVMLSVTYLAVSVQHGQDNHEQPELDSVTQTSPVEQHG